LLHPHGDFHTLSASVRLSNEYQFEEQLVNDVQCIYVSALSVFSGLLAVSLFCLSWLSKFPEGRVCFLKMNVLLMCSSVVSLAVARELGIVFVDFYALTFGIVIKLIECYRILRICNMTHFCIGSEGGGIAQSV
jgi:hypothetical protein